jgi:hypothetical protein
MEGGGKGKEVIRDENDDLERIRRGTFGTQKTMIKNSRTLEGGPTKKTINNEEFMNIKGGYVGTRNNNDNEFVNIEVGTPIMPKMITMNF